MTTTFADLVEEGDLLEVILDGKVHWERVVSIDFETRKGTYAPLTTAGTILVDNVLASCYADFAFQSVVISPSTPENALKIIFVLWTRYSPGWHCIPTREVVSLVAGERGEPNRGRPQTVPTFAHLAWHSDQHGRILQRGVQLSNHLYPQCYPHDYHCPPPLLQISLFYLSISNKPKKTR